jgi:hypothetical protein
MRGLKGPKLRFAEAIQAEAVVNPSPLAVVDFVLSTSETTKIVDVGMWVGTVLDTPRCIDQ